jgi:hypothetical protein
VLKPLYIKAIPAIMGEMRDNSIESTDGIQFAHYETDWDFG